MLLKGRLAPFRYDAYTPTDLGLLSTPSLASWLAFLVGCSGLVSWVRESLRNLLPQKQYDTLTLLSIQGLTPTSILSKPTVISPSVFTVNGRDTWSTFSNQSNSSAVLASSSSPMAKLSPKSPNSSCVTPSVVSFGHWLGFYWARSERCKGLDG